MCKSLPKLTAKDALSLLYGRFIESVTDLARLEQTIIAHTNQRGESSPLNILSGVGAFISCFFLCGFLVTFRVIRFSNPFSFVAWGTLFIIIAILIHTCIAWFSKPSSHSFLCQMASCLMLSGKTIFFIGIGQDSAWGGAFATLLVTITTWHLFPKSLDRHLSAVLTTFLFWVAIFHPPSGQAEEILVYIYTLLHLTLAGLLLTSNRLRLHYLPLLRALVTSLCFFLLLHNGDILALVIGKAAFNWTVIDIMIFTAFVALSLWVGGGLKGLGKDNFLLIFIGGVILTWLSATGVMLSICLLVLGHARSSGFLSRMGIIFGPLYIFSYYYDLDVDLLTKSGILVGSGLVLLLGYAFLSYRNSFIRNTETR